MNALMKKLEGERGKVTGMKMLLPINDVSLFRVQVNGLDFSDGKLRVKVSPLDGVGEISVEPAKLVDDNDAERDLYFRRYQASKYHRQHRPYTVTNLRIRVQKEVKELEKEHAKDVAEVVGTTPISKQSEHDLRSVFRQLVNLRFGLEREESIASTHYSN